MTIQLTQQWDCGRRDLFRSSGTWTPQAGWMIGDGDGGGGEGKWAGGVSGVGGWLRQREHSLKDRVSRCCPGVLPRDLREHPTGGSPYCALGDPQGPVPRPGPSQVA